MKVVGVVLAGGLSRRFGSPKAFARLSSKNFYEQGIEALEPISDEVIVVTREELVEHFSREVNVITDLPEFAGLGPLAGIYAAMVTVEADLYAVLPCDMPFVNGRIMEQVRRLHQGSVTAVRASGKYHPLVSIWCHEMKKPLYEALQLEQLSVMKLVQKWNINWLEGSTLTENEERIFNNINTPIDLERC